MTQSSLLRSPLRPARAGLLALLSACLALPAAAEVREEKVDRVLETAGITKLRLQNVNGGVRVTSGEKPSVHILAVKKAKGARAEQVLRETEVKITRNGGTLDVETVLPKQNRLFGLFGWGEGSGAEVSYEIELPPTLAVDVETVNGRVVAERRSAPLTLNTVNGSVRVDAHDSSLQVNTVNGSVEVSFVGALKSADLETVNGSVTVTCPRESSIQYSLQTVNGRIKSEFPEVVVEGKWGPKEARGSIAGGRERLSVETVNGEVRLLVGAAGAGPGVR